MQLDGQGDMLGCKMLKSSPLPSSKYSLTLYGCSVDELNVDKNSFLQLLLRIVRFIPLHIVRASQDMR